MEKDKIYSIVRSCMYDVSDIPIIQIKPSSNIKYELNFDSLDMIELQTCICEKSSSLSTEQNEFIKNCNGTVMDLVEFLYKNQEVANETKTV